MKRAIFEKPAFPEDGSTLVLPEKAVKQRAFFLGKKKNSLK